MIDALQKTLETVRGTLEAEVKSAAAERSPSTSKQTGQKPDNFTGVEGNGAASIQFRRKSSAYALSDEAVALLRDNGIEPKSRSPRRNCSRSTRPMPATKPCSRRSRRR
jgi:hypothetical protein